MALTKIRGNSQIMDLSIGNAQIATNAGIELSKIEDGAKLIKADGTVSFTSPISGVTPTLGSHLTTKEYVDSVATGLDVKLSVRAISTSNIALTGSQTVDGVELVAGDRVLVVGQTTASENGIYVVGAGAWSRSSDADNTPAGEVTSGMFTFVEEGTTYTGAGFVLTTANPIVLGTTGLQFAQFSSAGVVVGGAGLVKTGNTLDVVSSNGGIVVNANDIALTLADSTLAITSSGLKLASLDEGKILIGDATNTAAAQFLSGDVTMTAAGLVTIANDAITNVKIADSTISLTKLASGTSGQIIVAGGSGVPTYTTLSGDATISNTGVLTISNDAVDTAQIVDEAVALDKLVTLDNAKFIVGTSTGNAQVAITGDVTVDSTGAAAVNSATVVRVADIITRETPSGAVDGVNVTFALANTPKVGTEHVYVNGLLMDAGAGNDYTISGGTITMLFALNTGDKIRVSYFK